MKVWEAVASSLPSAWVVSGEMMWNNSQRGHCWEVSPAGVTHSLKPEAKGDQPSSLGHRNPQAMDSPVRCQCSPTAAGEALSGADRGAGS